MTGIPVRRPVASTLRLGSFKKQLAPLAAPTAAQVAPDPNDTEERARRRAENVRQERELQRQARARHAQQTNALLAELRTRWPHLFTSPIPLAKGIKKVIAAEMGSAAPPHQVLGRALGYWTRSRAYLEAVAAGTRRVALDGLDAGEPMEDERQHAREMLAQRKVRRQDRGSGSSGAESAFQPIRAVGLLVRDRCMS